MLRYAFTVEMFIDGKWSLQWRYYWIKKKYRTDPDVKDIPNKRRNFKFVGYKYF
jgi:hypothetical protein